MEKGTFRLTRKDETREENVSRGSSHPVKGTDKVVLTLMDGVSSMK